MLALGVVRRTAVKKRITTYRFKKKKITELVNGKSEYEMDL